MLSCFCGSRDNDTLSLDQVLAIFFDWSNMIKRIDQLVMEGPLTQYLAYIIEHIFCAISHLNDDPLDFLGPETYLFCDRKIRGEERVLPTEVKGRYGKLWRLKPGGNIVVFNLPIPTLRHLQQGGQAFGSYYWCQGSPGLPAPYILSTSFAWSLHA